MAPSLIGGISGNKAAFAGTISYSLKLEPDSEGCPRRPRQTLICDSDVNGHKFPLFLVVEIERDIPNARAVRREEKLFYSTIRPVNSCPARCV
jgi:hypothetical protein